MENVEDLAESTRIIDDAATRAGRRPGAIRRLLNINGRFGDSNSEKLFHGGVADWAEQISDLALAFGIGTFILGSDDEIENRRYGEEVAPAARELVTAEGEGMQATAQ